MQGQLHIIGKLMSSDSAIINISSFPISPKQIYSGYSSAIVYIKDILQKEIGRFNLFDVCNHSPC